MFNAQAVIVQLYPGDWLEMNDKINWKLTIITWFFIKRNIIMHSTDLFTAAEQATVRNFYWLWKEFLKYAGNKHTPFPEWCWSGTLINDNRFNCGRIFNTYGRMLINFLIKYLGFYAIFPSNNHFASVPP